MNPELYDILRSPIITEKTTGLSSKGQVAFRVSCKATKKEIKRAVETIFDVKVVAVNTMNVKGKKVRFKGIPGRRKNEKKAIITLAEGATIDIAAGIT